MSRSPTNAQPLIVGSSPALKAVLRDAKRLAVAERCLLITGETGTGKELVAEQIYLWWIAGSTGDTVPERSSVRPFLIFNCAAIPDELAESELFGHEEGAFTGARRRHQGLFKQADGGMLFLDEVGDLSLVVQAKLLRALQNGEIRPLGGERVIHVRVRVIAATHKDLRAEVAARRFREDLFYRLNAGMPICLPPLRERRGDIPALVDFALKRANASGGRQQRIRRAALAVLVTNNWPGNVRELFGVVENAAALSSTWITRGAVARGLGMADDGPGQAADLAAAALAEMTDRDVLAAARLRDVTGCSRKEGHEVLRELQRHGKIARRGQGRSTYYVPASESVPPKPTPTTTPPTAIASVPPVPGDLNARQVELVATLPIGDRVTTGEYCRRFGVGRATAFRDLDALAGANVLATVGRGRGAAYVRRPA